MENDPFLAENIGAKEFQCGDGYSKIESIFTVYKNEYKGYA